MNSLEQKVITVRNPRTGEIDYKIEPPTMDELTTICQNLRESQSQWEQLGVQGRINIFEKWKKVLENSREELITSLSIDTGRERESIREVDNIPKWIDRWSKIAVEQLDTVTQPTVLPSVEAKSDYSPYPLVGVISPWNFPLSLSLMDAIPALIAGSAVIIKPSEVTPRFVEPLMKTIEEVPELAKVVQYIVGAGETGADLIENVDMICFTGSVSTGRKVAVRAAERFIPSFLELGGKDPAIVLKSADIERATSAILVGSVLGVGHQCYSIERIFVAEEIYESFVQRLIDKATQLKLAYPEYESGEVGPIIFAPQARIIEEHLNEATSRGATIHCGGKIEEINGGLWCRPTVVTGVSTDMKLMKEETFGPIMPVMPFSNLEDAIRIANESQYGLSGAVFAGSQEEAEAVARHLNVGGVSINDTGLTPFLIGEPGQAERNAFGLSGLGGSRLGSAAIKRFVRSKILLSNSSSEKSPWWYNVQ